MIDSKSTVPRLLHIATSADERMGGSVRAPLSIAAALESLDVRSEVAATCRIDDDLRYLDAEFSSVTTHLFDATLPRHNFRSPGLKSWLSDNVESYDAVALHGVFSFPMLYGARISAQHGVPYFVHPHGQLEPYDLAKHRLAKEAFGFLVGRSILRGAKSIVSATEMESDRLHAFGAKVDRCVVPLPVDSGRRGDGGQFRRRVGIPEDEFLLLHMGRLDHKKGLQFTIPAVSSLRAQGLRVKLLICGTGTTAEKEAIDRSIAASPLGSTAVLNHGFISGSDRADAFDAANLFVLPSLNENFGIALVEALHYGVPALISGEVYAGRLPVREGAATLCDCNVNSVRSELLRLIEEPQRLSRMAARTQKTARDFFGSQVVGRALKRVYGVDDE